MAEVTNFYSQLYVTTIGVVVILLRIREVLKEVNLLKTSLQIGSIAMITVMMLGSVIILGTSHVHAQATCVNNLCLTPLPPIANRNDFYGGSTIPVKFQLTDTAGHPVSTATATISVDGASPLPPNTGNTFSYSASDQVYHYNLSTKPYSAGPGSPSHTITITVNGGPSETFTVTFD